jgi:hypothetical protein
MIVYRIFGLWKPNTQSYAKKTGTGDFFPLDLQELRANEPEIYFVPGIYDYGLKGSVIKNNENHVQEMVAKKNPDKKSPGSLL